MQTKLLESAHADEFAIVRTQDVEPFLESAKRARIEGEMGTGDMRLAAEFPAVLIEQYCTANHITFNEFLTNSDHVARMLNDPDLAGFRIWEGRV